MKPEALEYLCCPSCKGDLDPSGDRMQRGHLESGSLRCLACGISYPIERGVPDFVVQEGEADVEQTTRGFARNWDAFNETILAQPALNDELFRDWIHPLDPESFEGKVVLEPGCGMGRWLHVASAYRPKALIGLDYSPVAYTASANTRALPHVHVVRGDIRRMPVKSRVEVLYCIGVIHHMPDPSEAFDALAGVLAEDGRMTVWVYGKENNGWLTSVVSPFREKVASRMPHVALSALSKALTAQLFAAAALYDRFGGAPPQGGAASNGNGATHGAGGNGFAYGEYLRYLRRYPFKYMEHIVYDHLVPKIAHYIAREDLEAWARRNGLAHKTLARNNNSWRIHAARREDLLPSEQGEA